MGNFILSINGQTFVNQLTSYFLSINGQTFVNQSMSYFLLINGQTFVNQTMSYFLSIFFLTQFLCQAICTQRTPKGPK